MPLRDTKTDYAPNGAVIEVHPAISVQFQKSGGAPDWAKDAVRQLPGFANGIGEDEDPFTRVGVLDTDDEAKRQNWSDEDKKFVEDALLKAPSNGVEYVICSAPRTSSPWPTYDEFVGEDAVAKILYTIDMIGADPKHVVRYEKENLDRTDVIDAVEALIEKDEEDVVGLITA